MLIIAAIIFVVVGFVCGQVVKALTTLPGDADDPVATQSYVEAKLGEQLAALNTRLEEVEAELAALKGSGNVTPSGSSNSGNSSSNNSGFNNSGTTTSNNNNNTSSGQTVRITGNSVNVRSGPGTNYDIIGSMNNGDTATLVGSNGSWYQIRRGNSTGYVSAQYATVQ